MGFHTKLCVCVVVLFVVRCVYSENNLLDQVLSPEAEMNTW